LLGRYGGEEFGIILRRCPPENGRIIADKLRDALVADPLTLRDGSVVKPHVSVGVATFAGGADAAATDVTSAADRALYAAKAGGRNRTEMA
jgi:diguanylate cyclase (GGDEF)-like protein